MTQVNEGKNKTLIFCHDLNQEFKAISERRQHSELTAKMKKKPQQIKQFINFINDQKHEHKQTADHKQISIQRIQSTIFTH